MATRRAPRFTTVTPLTFKERLAALENIPAFFKLVWQAGPAMTLANIFLRLIRASLPLSILYVGKLIIDGVVQLSNHQSAIEQTYLWKLVAVEFALVIVSDALGRAIALIDSLLGDIVANHSSVKIMQHAATLDLDQFEDAVFYDKLERARQQTVNRTVLLSQVLTQLQDALSMLFLAGGLLAFNPWLFLLLMVAVLPAFWGEAILTTRYTL